jgi:hypothetical protein
MAMGFPKYGGIEFLKVSIKKERILTIKGEMIRIIFPFIVLEM